LKRRVAAVDVQDLADDEAGIGPVDTGVGDLVDMAIRRTGISLIRSS